MKVLFITPEFPPMEGGMGDYTHTLGQALAALGLEVRVLTSVQGDSASAGLAVYPDIQQWGWGSWGPGLRLIVEQQPQVVHLQYQAAGYGMHPAANLLPWRVRLRPNRPRLVVTFHDLRVPYLFPKAGLVRRWAMQALAWGCDAAIVTNEEDALALRRWGLGDRMAHIPIGSNIDVQYPAGYDRQAWRIRWGIGPEAMLLGYFGFLNASKGVDILLQALQDLVGSGVDLHLLMVGGKTGASDPTNVAYAQHIEALIGALNLSCRVHWTGFVSGPEVSAALGAVDLCVLPYRDGISFRRGSLMACLAHGCPIVSTWPRVPLPVLRPGENVWLVSPNDPQALAQGVAVLAQDAGLRQRLGKGACCLAQEFTWPAIARQTTALYERLVA